MIQWVPAEVFQAWQKAIRHPLNNTAQHLLLMGNGGWVVSDFLNHFVRNLPEKNILLGRFDFNQNNPPTSYLPFKIIVALSDGKNDHFLQFLNQFPTAVQNNILQKLKTAVSDAQIRQNWAADLFFHFLNTIAQDQEFILILENIQSIPNHSMDHLEKFILQLRNFPIRLVFTSDSSLAKFRPLNFQETISFDRMSVFEVESRIKDYYPTSPMNARLITNHCYLKTSGNPLLIRLLLEGIYRKLVEEAGTDFINITQLHKIRIPGEAEAIFQITFSHLNPKIQNLLVFLANLNRAVNDEELKMLLPIFSLESKDLLRLLQGGLIREYIDGQDRNYDVFPAEWKEWLCRNGDLTAIRGHLNKIANLKEKLPGLPGYSLSSLLYDLEEMELAVAVAEEEADYHSRNGEWEAATEKLHFIYRIFRLYPDLISQPEAILEKLGNAYFKLGAYDNAFEIYRQLKEQIISRDSLRNPEVQKKWLNLNTKLAQALIALDGFQEARYLIRDTRVKKFCDSTTIALCQELLGDIEANQAHPTSAINHYLEALTLYEKSSLPSAVFALYQKLKPLFPENSRETEQLTDRCLRYLEKTDRNPDFLSLILKDKIQLQIRRQQFKEALISCRKLRSLLNRIYEPKFKIQLLFHLGEIYGQLGKWKFAIHALNKIVNSAEFTHMTYSRIHGYLQLGLIYEEQARFGLALHTYQQGLDLAREMEFQAEKHELKLHIGHVYLSVHGLLRARDHFMEVHHWAEKNQNHDLLILARLYLAYYEIKRRRLDSARSWLHAAKKVVNLQKSPLDYLNYLIYHTLWLIEKGRFTHARTVGNLLSKKAEGNYRYHTVSAQLLTICSIRSGDETAVKKELPAALELTHKWKLPQLRYMLLCEAVRWYRDRNQTEQFRQYLQEACNLIRKISEEMGDDILKTMFWESRTHEDILAWGKEYSLL
ncbi:MAG: hypothetical protein Kow0042_04940 [Calditrichia bacterium]